MPVGLGYGRPDEHRGLRQSRLPSKLVQPLHENVAASAIVFAYLGHAFLRALERQDRRNLNRREGSVIEVALEARQCGYERLITDHESYAPTGHVVALREGKEFNGDLASPGDFQDRRRAEAIEDD